MPRIVLLGAKRAVDLVAGTALAVLVTPVIAVLALASAIQFRCWPFFVHDRIGAGGRPFRVCKLRSLPAGTHPYASKHTLGRANRYGALLRRTHLDELPQLWLVPPGTMSLVGPRPKMPDWAEPIEPSFGQLRTSVKPGCTGLWQIGAHAHLEVAASPQYDLAYLQRWSLRMDLWILWRTALTVARIGRPVAVGAIPAWCLGDGLIEPATGALEPRLEAA